MSLRSWIAVIGLIVLSVMGALLFYRFLSSQLAPGGGTPSSVPVVEQPAEPPLMTPVPGLSEGPQDSRALFLQQLNLIVFEAVINELEICRGDSVCLEEARMYRNWICAQDVCDGKENKQPFDCFETIIDQFSQEVQDQINSLLCPVIKVPSKETWQALLAIPGVEMTEAQLVRRGSHLLASKESALACEEFIRNYVGDYGPQWDASWYRGLSGCRIIARERTRMEEEEDFYTWLGVTQGLADCSQIVNSEMRKACSAPQAASPVPHSLINDGE